jgi:ATP-binding cassette subfamily B protein
MGMVNNQLENVRTRGRHVDSLNAIFGSSAFVVFMSTVLVITMSVTWLVLQGNLGVDKIALYAALFQMVVGSVQQLLNILPQFSKSMASVRSIGEILECPDLEENEGKTKLTEVKGYIDFRNISFSYSEQKRPAVADFELSVSPGACVAFVGESGSGKSTLMQLAIGFLRPQSGQILLDGIPMDSLDMRTWRRHIAMVPQNTILFSGTIRDNIGYGLDPITDEDIWQAIQVANLTSVIEELPQKLDTRVGENGLKLSGGQRQRLAIARAVIRNPKVIILDEATSALDVISEHEVQTAIENLIHGRTTFIVAHRLSTIRQANLVVVMDEGRAIEIGSPDELQAAGGAFAKLKSLQSNN